MNAEDVKTYNIDNLYEVSVYKYSKIHTKYILGLNNELVAQATSENATLVTAHDPAVINKQYNTDTVTGSVRYVYSMASFLVWHLLNF